MSTVLENSGGPGSSITLDPEIISMRNKYLKALEGKSFDDMNSLIQKQLETEDDDIKRLSLLAARVYILRLRTLELRDEPTENAMPWSKTEDKTEVDTKKAEEKVDEGAEVVSDEWRRLRMIEAGEVNGVRFPPGIIIDVNSVDGQKLVESKKAEFVDTTKPEEEVNKDEKDSSENKEEGEITKDNSEDTTSENSEKPQEEKADVDNLADELEELSNSISSEVEIEAEKKDDK
ncbi:MAG: hypothetical protein ACJ0BU_09435 [Candidatus Puniceispirillales bacterium]